ncbi:MAG: glycerophosphodiester phosphodiesterase [Flavobacterium sp.]
MNKLLIIGHRGAKGYEPENTLISFRKAIDMKVDGIELDVHLSSDGEIIVFHNNTLDGMTNGKGNISQYSLSELKDFRIENKHQIPTLKEVFDLVDKKCFINIELKVNTATKPVLDLIEDYILNKNWNYEHFQISSFDWNLLEEVSKINPDIFIGVLTQNDLDSAFEFAKTINAKSINPYFKLLSAENSKKIKTEGLQIFPWTVNETSDIEKIKSFKVNGIITDFPDRV